MTSVTAGRSGVLLREPPSLRAPLFDTTAPTLIFTALLARMALGLERGSYVKSRRRHAKSRRRTPTAAGAPREGDSKSESCSRGVPRAPKSNFERLWERNGTQNGAKMEPKWSQNGTKMFPEMGSETVSDSDLVFCTFLLQFPLMFEMFRDEFPIPF